MSGRNCCLVFAFSMLLFKKEENLVLLVGISLMNLMRLTCVLVSVNCKCFSINMRYISLITVQSTKCDISTFLYRRFHLMPYVISLDNVTMVGVSLMTGTGVHWCVFSTSITVPASSPPRATSSLAVEYTMPQMLLM